MTAEVAPARRSAWSRENVPDGGMLIRDLTHIVLPPAFEFKSDHAKSAPPLLTTLFEASSAPVL